MKSFNWQNPCAVILSFFGNKEAGFYFAIFCSSPPDFRIAGTTLQLPR